MDYTKLTLGILLSAKDEIIKRNAQSILKRLQTKTEVCRKCEEYHRDGIYHICPNNQ